MLLSHIFERIDIAASKTIKRNYYDVDHKAETRLRKLGAGANGSAYELPGDMTKALKIGDTSKTPLDDGYVAWIHATSHDHDNPFYPQVDDMKMAMSTRGGHVYRARMEKLVGRESISAEEAEQLFPRFLNLEITATMREFVQHEAKVMRTSLAREYTKRFAAMLRSHVKQTATNETQITDSNLRQAVQLMQTMTKRGYDLDLHSGNIMFRRTPHGLQPVITDPFDQKSGSTLS